MLETRRRGTAGLDGVPAEQAVTNEESSASPRMGVVTPNPALNSAVRSLYRRSILVSLSAEALVRRIGLTASAVPYRQ